MNLSRSACLVLGAAVGVASAYLLRNILFRPWGDGSDKKDGDHIKPKILINGVDVNGNGMRRRCTKRFRDRVLPKIPKLVQNVQMECSKLCDRDVWKIIIPIDQPSKSSSPVFYDARAELSPINFEAGNWLYNRNDYTSTDHRSLPSTLPDSRNSDNIHSAGSKESVKMPEMRSHQDNECKSMAQSTMIDSNDDKSPLKRPIWDRTLRELMALNKISVISDECKDVEVVVRINMSKSPIKQFYKKVTNLIRPRKSLNDNI